MVKFKYTIQEKPIKSKPANLETIDLFIDDTVATMKHKIVSKMNDGTIADELYVYYETYDFYDTRIANKQLLTSKKPDVSALNTNILETPELISLVGNKILFKEEINTEKINYKRPLSVFSHDDNGNHDYTFDVDPYKLETLMKPDGVALYSSSKKNNIRNQQRLIDCNFKTDENDTIILYVIKISDILKHIETTNKTTINSSELINKYFPYFKKYALTTVKEIKDERETLKLALKKKTDYFWKFNELISEYKKHKSDVSCISGIKSFEFILKNKYDSSFPMEAIFKNIHANHEMPVIKYNPGFKRENLYRLYSNSINKKGQQISPYTKREIINMTTDVINFDEIAVAIKPHNNDEIKNLLIIFNSNGNVIIKGMYNTFFKSREQNELIDELVSDLEKYVTPKLNNINSYLELSGYKINAFEMKNIIINKVDFVYEMSVNKIFKKNALNKNMFLLQPFFSVGEPRQEGAITKLDMRFKRVHNYKEPDLDEEIMEFIENNVNEAEIISYISNKYELKYVDAIAEIERVRGNNMYEIKAKKQGFLTHINAIEYGKNKKVVFTFDNVTSFDYYDVLKDYSRALTSLILDNDVNSKITKISKELRSVVEEKEEDIEEEENYEEDKRLFDNVGLDAFFEDDLKKDKVESIADEDDDIDDLDDDDDDDDDDIDDIDDEDDDEEVTGGKSKRDIKEYFDERKRRLNPDIFNHIEYSRTCLNNQDKQPVPITASEKEKLDVTLNKIIPDDKLSDIHYVCPRYWDTRNDVVVPPEEANKLKNYIIPKSGPINDDQYIYEFYDKVVHKSQDNYKNTNPYMTKEIINIDGTSSGPFPCCGIRNDSNNKNKYENDSSSYITEWDSNKRLLNKQFGFLPEIIEKNLFNLHIKKELNKAMTEVKGLTLLRCGAEMSINKSFVACIAKIMDITMNNLRELIDKHVTIDNYIFFNKGLLYTMFLPKNVDIKTNVDKTDYKTTSLYDFIDLNNDSNKEYNGDKKEILQKELNTFFGMLVASFENFKKYINDIHFDKNGIDKSEYILDHTILLDILLADDNLDAIMPKLNIVILEVDNKDSINILCPTNSMFEYNLDYDVAYILKRDNLYENLGVCKKWSTNYRPEFKIKPENHIHTKLSEEEKIQKKTYEIIEKLSETKKNIDTKMTSGIKRPFKIKDLQDKLEEKTLAINQQLVNNQFLTTGITVKSKNGTDTNEYFIPTAQEPPIIINNAIEIDNINGIETHLQSYDDTITFFAKTINNIGITLDKALHYENTVYGFLTNTLQFVPIKPIELTEIVDKIKSDNIELIKMSYYYSADSISTIVNNEKKQTGMRNARLETTYYNVFRAILRHIVSEYGSTEKRKEIEDVKTKIEAINGECTKEEKKTYIKDINNKLKTLMKDYIVFKDDNSYKKPSKYTDITLCLTNADNKEGICEKHDSGEGKKHEGKIIIPEQNLNNKKIENSNYYYTRLTDELVRYSQVRQFILEPDSKMNITDDTTHINAEEEFIITETTLKNDKDHTGSKKTVGKIYPFVTPYKLSKTEKL